MGSRCRPRRSGPSGCAWANPRDAELGVAAGAAIAAGVGRARLHAHQLGVEVEPVELEVERVEPVRSTPHAARLESGGGLRARQDRCAWARCAGSSERTHATRLVDARRRKESCTMKSRPRGRRREEEVQELHDDAHPDNSGARAVRSGAVVRAQARRRVHTGRRRDQQRGVLQGHPPALSSNGGRAEDGWWMAHPEPIRSFGCFAWVDILVP